MSSPAIANGVLYIGSMSGHLYAIDQQTSQEQWHFKSSRPITSSPAIADGTVFFVWFEAKGLHGYPPAAPTIPDAWDVFTSSPAVANGVLHVGSWYGNFYALDAATGRRKWDYPTSKSWVNGTPAVRDGVVYVGTSDSSRFMALDARSGRLLFNFDAKSYVFSSAALAGGLAHFGSHNGRLYAIDARTGAKAWEFQTPASQADRLRILNPDGSLDQQAFVPLFGDFQDMYIDFYRFASIGGIMGSPVVDQGTVYFGSLDGNVYALH